MVTRNLFVEQCFRMQRFRNKEFLLQSFLISNCSYYKVFQFQIVLKHKVSKAYYRYFVYLQYALQIIWHIYAILYMWYTVNNIYLYQSTITPSPKVGIVSLSGKWKIEVRWQQVSCNNLF